MVINSQPKPHLPKCWRKKATGAGGRRQCTNAGFACWVSGSFGRQAMVLCLSCQDELRAVGWTVRYQIEGDNPAAKEEE